MDNYAELKPSVGLVVSQLSSKIRFSDETILNVAQGCLDNTRKAVSILNHQFSYGEFRKDNFLQQFEHFFGELNVHHPFNYQQHIVFEASEPKITKAIAEFIDPSTQGAVGQKRLISFLNSLSLCPYANHAVLASYTSPTSHSFKIDAEYLISGKRADLFIRWMDANDTKFGVVIEAKFSHHVTTGQLSFYRTGLHKYVKNKANSALILLTLNGDAAPKNNKDWQSKSWLSVMARWERNLVGDNDQGFSLLRQFIWNKLRN